MIIINQSLYTYKITKYSFLKIIYYYKIKINKNACLYLELKKYSYFKR